MQYLDTHGRITISEAYGFITNVSKPTVKNRVADLKQKQDLLNVTVRAELLGIAMLFLSKSPLFFL